MIHFKTHELLDLLRPLLNNDPIIVEAGAFTGSDTFKFAQIWPTAQIHAFEPVPILYEQLVARVHHLPTIACYPLALGAINGKIPFHVMHKKSNPHTPSQAGSLHKPIALETAHTKMRYEGTIMVNITTLDTWAQKYNISHIDLLWLDLQGHEKTVLEHALTILPHIRFIYTEVNFVARYEQQPMYSDIKQWLELHGFTEIARDFTSIEGKNFGNCLFKQL